MGRLNKFSMTWLVTVIAMGFLVHCGSDNVNTAQAPTCSFPIQNFVGGDTSFTVNESTIQDGCANGLIISLLKQYDPTFPGPYPQVNIPGYDVLKNGTSVQITLPFVGPVTAKLNVSGDAIGLQIPTNTYPISSCAITAGVSGQLTPCSAAKVDHGSLSITILSISGGTTCGEGLIATPCAISFSVSGS